MYACAQGPEFNPQRALTVTAAPLTQQSPESELKGRLSVTQRPGNLSCYTQLGPKAMELSEAIQRCSRLLAFFPQTAVKNMTRPDKAMTSAAR